MRLRKVIRKIVALGTGATMVGATILGAMAAADLSNYPTPFIKDGAFNALIVVGSAAKTEDVLGSIDIATSLQYANTVTTVVPGTGTTISVIGEGAKIETDSNKLVLGESLATVKTSLDNEDLPTLLAKGTYVADGDDESTGYEYTQKLEFGAAKNASVQFLRNRDYTDEDNPYVLLYGPKSSGSGSTKTWFMRYTLDFSKDAKSSWYSGTTCGSANEMCDFEDAKLEMMGIEYDITKAEYDGTSAITWEMMGGVSLNTMYEGETKTFTINGVDYEVTVDIISDTGSSSESVIITVNGDSTKELYKDQTDKVAGIEVGIKQVMGNEAGEAGAGRDLMQFYLGAQKITLSDDSALVSFDSNVKLGGQEVDDLYVDFTHSEGTDSVKIDKIQLTWAPGDKLFAGVGDELVLPGLESFKVEFGGMTHDGNEEEIILEPHGDDNIMLVAPLEAGKTSVDVLYSTGTYYTGLGERTTAGQGKLNVAAGVITEGDYIVLTSATERETHIVLLDDVSTQNITRLKDLADGTKYEGTCTATCTINVGDVHAVFSSANSNGTAVLAGSADVGAKIYTKEGLTIDLSGAPGVNATTHSIYIVEETENSVLEGGNNITITAGITGDSATTISGVDQTSSVYVLAPGESDRYYQYADTKKWGMYTTFGTKVVWDKSGDEYEVVITYPGEEAHANVFVNSLAAVVTEGGGGGTYEQVQKIEVGAAVLDTEVASLKAQNTIVVGGPCVNSLAAELMGNPADCTEGFEMGKAMIKLFEHDNENVALLVAGYSAMDTRRGARVVANYGDYPNFAGTELEVTGTSLSDIQVGVPTPAETGEAEAEAEAEGE